MKSFFKPQMARINADGKRVALFHPFLESKSHLRTSAPSAVELQMIGGEA